METSVPYMVVKDQKEWSEGVVLGGKGCFKRKVEALETLEPVERKRENGWALCSYTRRPFKRLFGHKNDEQGKELA